MRCAEWTAITFWIIFLPVMALRTRRNEAPKERTGAEPGSLAHLRERGDGRVSALPVGIAFAGQHRLALALAMDGRFANETSLGLGFGRRDQKPRQAAPRTNLSLQSLAISGQQAGLPALCTEYKCRCGSWYLRPLQPVCWNRRVCAGPPLVPCPLSTEIDIEVAWSGNQHLCCWRRTRGGNGTWLWLDPWERLAGPPHPRSPRARARAKSQS